MNKAMTKEFAGMLLGMGWDRIHTLLKPNSRYMPIDFNQCEIRFMGEEMYLPEKYRIYQHPFGEAPRVYGREELPVIEEPKIVELQIHRFDVWIYKTNYVVSFCWDNADVFRFWVGRWR